MGVGWGCLFALLWVCLCFLVRLTKHENPKCAKTHFPNVKVNEPHLVTLQDLRLLGILVLILNWPAT